MADQSIIKEFLVALGFKVDDAKLKKFEKSIDSTTKFVGKLAAGVEVMAAAVETAVVKVSTQFENLYYASQRLQDTVADIRGFSFAMGQVGSTGKAGLQAMENVAEFLRSYPGGGRFLQGLGVDLKYVHGQAQVTSETMSQLAKVFRAMPYARAKVYANVLGIDPNTLQAMLRGTDEAQAKFHDLAQRMGVDQDKAAEASKNFMNDLRELLAVITLTFDKIILRIQPIADQVTKGLEDLDKATGGWSTSLIVLTGLLLPLLAVLDPIWVVLAGLALLLTQVDWTPWSVQLGGVSKAFDEVKEAIGEVWEIFEPFWNVVKQSVGDGVGKAFGLILAFLTFSLRLFADVLRLVVDLLTGNWSKAWADAGKIARDTISGIVDLAKKGVGVLAAFWNMGHDDPNKKAAPAAPAAANDGGGGGAASGTVGFNNNNPGNLRRWGDNPIVGGFARFATPLAGLTAMAKNIQAYSRRGLNSVASIISTWAPKSDHNDTEAYIRDVAKKLGVAAGEQLNLKDPSTLIKLMSAITTHENGRNPYSGALMSSAASAALGRPVAVTQETHITVHGHDPQATARAVAGEQERVNNRMARDLKVAAS